jgi:hypothetical protein
MAFTDLLSSSFLFSIAIIIILIGAIFAYVSYRMSEQDHKISSMLGLVSTMAEEMQFFRNKLSKQQNNLQPADTVDYNHSILDTNNFLNLVPRNDELISVSDDGSEEENDEEEDNDDVTETEDVSSSEEDDEDEASGSEADETDLNILDQLDVDNIEDLEENLNLNIHPETNILHDNNIDNETNNIKTIHLEENHNISDETFSGDLKNITIFDLEETNKKTTDYKKLALNKLREIVIEKGLIVDASKLKKPELLKMLEDEPVI